MGVADDVDEVGRVAVAGEVDALEVGALVELVGDALEALLVGDQHLGPGVLQAVDDLLGLPPPVEADEDGAAGDRGPEGQAPLRVVLAQHRHPVAVVHAGLFTQCVADAVGGGDEALEGPVLVAVAQEHLVATEERQLGDLAEARHALVVGLHLDAVDRGGRDLEHPSRPGELVADLGGDGHGERISPDVLAGPPSLANGVATARAVRACMPEDRIAWVRGRRARHDRPRRAT